MDKLQQLREPFPESDIEWRVQAADKKNGKVWARVLAYVTNRAIQERLDDVFGWDGWKNEFAYEHEARGAILCGISARADGRWVTKWDGAEQTDIEAVKGGLSNAMKRAAVQFGIGRYLYKLDAEFAEIVSKSKHWGKTKDGTIFYWNPPKLPAWALPNGGKPTETKNADTKATTPEPKKEDATKQPATGKAPLKVALVEPRQYATLIKLGADKNNLNSKAVEKVAMWYRKGDKMTKAECAALIKGWDAEFGKFMDAEEMKQAEALDKTEASKDIDKAFGKDHHDTDSKD